MSEVYELGQRQRRTGKLRTAVQFVVALSVVVAVLAVAAWYFIRGNSNTTIHNAPVVTRTYK